MGALIIVMGVSGCGKSAVGQKLSLALESKFLEGDAFHPPASIAKMASGTPLTDEDRAAWLDAILDKVQNSEAPIVTLACSALTPYVQERFSNGTPRHLIWLWLSAPQNIIAKRLQTRDNHFMPPALLSSQFSALNPPSGAIEIDVSRDIETVVSDVLERLSALSL